jgi:hypothetical protein
MGLIRNYDESEMKTVHIRFVVAVLTFYVTPAFPQNNAIDQIDSMLRRVMPPTANCEIKQFPLHCEFDRPSFKLLININNNGTADVHFTGTKQEIETNMFRVIVLFDRIFGISRKNIEECTYPLTPIGYNRQVVLEKSHYKLYCSGVQTPAGTYNADIHRAIQD